METWAPSENLKGGLFRGNLIGHSRIGIQPAVFILIYSIELGAHYKLKELQRYIRECRRMLVTWWFTISSTIPVQETHDIKYQCFDWNLIWIKFVVQYWKIVYQWLHMLYYLQLPIWQNGPSTCIKYKWNDNSWKIPFYAYVKLWDFIKT